MPSISRPFDNASAVAISAARRTGLYRGNTTTAVPSRIRLVIEAQCATIINGDVHVQYQPDEAVVGSQRGESTLAHRLSGSCALRKRRACSTTSSMCSGESFHG